PLVNPPMPGNQLLGVYNLKLLRLYRYIAQNEGINCTIVHSLDGYDEISLTSPFKVVDNSRELILSASDLGLETVTPQDLYGGDTEESASRIFDDVLEGRASRAKKDCVIANAAFAISTLERDLDIAQAIAQARESLESGAALEAFRKFLDINS
ncbi:MAG: anthranilate phosphoribosyltransferase, partial [Muribaculaceae bacterium]|nr:anthranilate phosphoribosyltransferase [Muribaculaceae bacterium]